jgi:hypothetical protein
MGGPVVVALAEDGGVSRGTEVAVTLTSSAGPQAASRARRSSKVRNTALRCIADSSVYKNGAAHPECAAPLSIYP